MGLRLRCCHYTRSTSDWLRQGRNSCVTRDTDRDSFDLDVKNWSNNRWLCCVSCQVYRRYAAAAFDVVVFQLSQRALHTHHEQRLIFSVGDEAWLQLQIQLSAAVVAVVL